MTSGYWAILVFMLCCAFFLGGIAIGYHAGRESIRSQMVVCDDKKQADQPGTYLCVPANQWRATQ